MLQIDERISDVRRRFNAMPVPDVGCKRKSCLAVLWALHGSSATVLITAQNGPVNGLESNCSGEVGACGCIHAEIRLLLRAVKHVANVRDTVLTVNFSPCLPCAQAIIASGIACVVSWEHYAAQHPRAPALLQAAGIKTVGPCEGAMFAGEKAAQ